MHKITDILLSQFNWMIVTTNVPICNWSFCKELKMLSLGVIHLFYNQVRRRRVHIFVGASILCIYVLTQKPSWEMIVSKDEMKLIPTSLSSKFSLIPRETAGKTMEEAFYNKENISEGASHKNMAATEIQATNLHRRQIVEAIEKSAITSGRSAVKNGTLHSQNSSHESSKNEGDSLKGFLNHHIGNMFATIKWRACAGLFYTLNCLQNEDFYSLRPLSKEKMSTTLVSEFLDLLFLLRVASTSLLSPRVEIRSSGWVQTRNWRISRRLLILHGKKVREEVNKATFLIFSPKHQVLFSYMRKSVIASISFININRVELV